MSDFTVMHVGNIPVFMYSMIGLTVGAIALSTQFDAGSDKLPVPEPLSNTIMPSPAPPAVGGGKRRHTRSLRNKRKCVKK